MNDKKKVICLIGSCELPIPAVYGGAIETLVTLLAEQNEIEQKVEFIVVTNYVEEAYRLAQRYRHTRFICLNRDEKVDKKINDKIDFVRAVLRFFSRGWFVLPLRWKHFELKRNRKLRKLEADYIVAEGGTYLSFLEFARKFGKERIFVHIHHEMFADKKMDDIFGNAIGVSSFALNQYMKNSSMPIEKGKVVYNCIDEELFMQKVPENDKKEVRLKHGFREEDFLVIYSGRLVPEKGVKELIDAVLSLQEKSIRLLIVGGIRSALGGESDYYYEIMDMVKGSNGKVVYGGYVENVRMASYYQAADVQVVPSVWEEVAGLVTIEGMMSGIPLIVTKSGGMIEYVDDESVIQVERGEKLSENIAQAIMYLYQNPGEARLRGEKEREYAKRFTKRNYYYQFLSAFGIE